MQIISVIKHNRCVLFWYVVETLHARSATLVVFIYLFIFENFGINNLKLSERFLNKSHNYLVQYQIIAVEP